jgi:hypothetical protein
MVQEFRALKERSFLRHRRRQAGVDEREIPADQFCLKHMKRSLLISLDTKVRGALVLFLFVMLVIALASCESNLEYEPETKFILSDDHELKRNELRKELKILQFTIDRELDKLGKQSRATAQKNWSEMIVHTDNRLQSSKSRIEKALHDLDDASEEQWQDVELATRTLASEIKSSFHQIAYQIEDFYNGE